jgi:hypothetical protein
MLPGIINQLGAQRRRARWVLLRIPHACAGRRCWRCRLLGHTPALSLPAPLLTPTARCLLPLNRPRQPGEPEAHRGAVPGRAERRRGGRRGRGRRCAGGGYLRGLKRFCSPGLGRWCCGGAVSHARRTDVPRVKLLTFARLPCLCFSSCMRSSLRGLRDLCVVAWIAWLRTCASHTPQVRHVECASHVSRLERAFVLHSKDSYVAPGACCAPGWLF